MLGLGFLSACILCNSADELMVMLYESPDIHFIQLEKSEVIMQ